MPQCIFVAGGTGYIGRHLIPELAARGHIVRGLIRKDSRNTLPLQCTPVIGDALNRQSYQQNIHPADTFIHLIGVPHPSPAKAEQFKQIDLGSLREAILAAKEAAVHHFLFMSVAHPAPVMQSYIAIRTMCEEIIEQSKIIATVFRPWYVLGPGHRWPLTLLPAYWLLERLPATRESALRLGLVSIRQMVQSIVWAVENPPEAGNGLRIVDVPEIKRRGKV